MFILKYQPMRKSKNVTSKRLAFMRSFLNAILADINDIPHRIILPATLKMNLFIDDMSLSAAQRVIQYFGYTLVFQLIPRISNPRMPDYYQVNHKKRLSFIREFLHESGYPITEVATILGITRYAISYWFKRDDIQISRIYDIAQSFDADLEITILPMSEDEIQVPKRTMTLFIKSTNALNGIDKRRHARGNTVGKDE